MSYPVNLLTDSSKPANETHRLSVIRFKTMKDKPAKSPNKCVSIPRLKINVSPDILNASLNAAFLEMQDEVIRSLIVDNNATTINDDDISFTAIQQFQLEKSTSQRLSGESVKAWFDTCMSENLTLALSNAMQLPSEPSEEQLSKLQAAVSQHEQLIISLASPRSNYNKTLAAQLLKAIAVSDDDGLIRGKLQTKLNSFLEDKSLTLSINL